MTNPRIISGTARGIRLRVAPGDITRPITDRVKEALFNIIDGDITDSSWLDLFGGTGSVGIEALSRGATFVQFIDINHDAIIAIKENLLKTRLKEKAETIQKDAFRFLQQAANQRFDYIFVAPPQYKDLWESTLRILDGNPGWLVDDGWIVVQIDPVEYKSLILRNFHEIEQRKYGSTLLIFYERLSG
jgi:16S rRNA (guanine(966)-N(2))-methyltransferase RsmD